MKSGVIVFPGSNCDADCLHVLGDVFHSEVRSIWHKDTSLNGLDLVVIPGGFSYGDYLRCGAIAKFSPIMEEVVRFAQKGGTVLGICNGFQILIEAGLLPGALMRNSGLKFICDTVQLKLENSQTKFTQKGEKGHIYNIPIAHMDGNYYTDRDGLNRLEDKNQIVFRYADKEGNISAEANPNGSIGNIAGIINEAGNVLGMMPHPERVAEEILGSCDGSFIFESLMGAYE